MPATLQLVQHIITSRYRENSLIKREISSSFFWGGMMPSGGVGEGLSLFT